MFDPLSLIGTLGSSLLGGLFGMGAGNQQASATRAQAAAQERIAGQQIDWQREAAEMARQAQEEENRRRQIEASFRAAKLEDVAGMFQNLQNPQRVGGIEGLQDLGGMRDIASLLMGQDPSADLRKAAMRELGGSSNQLNAMMAQAGVRGSGFAAGQQRQLAGDVMSGLAQQIAQNRQQNLMGAGSILGQAGQMDLGMQQFNRNLDMQQNQFGANMDMERLSQIARLFQDDAFGANAPLPPGYGQTGANQGLAPTLQRRTVRMNSGRY